MNALVAYTSLVVLLFFATCMLTTTSNAAHAHNLHTKQRVVLISFDGFRHDFVERHNLGAFKKFARRGVRSSSLKPVFTTKTFPNHFTMATGLYEVYYCLKFLPIFSWDGVPGLYCAIHDIHLPFAAIETFVSP